jgi:molecular chaperone DnaK (HSP70)
LQEFDELRQRIALAKNNLESYIYSARGHLEESEVVTKVSTEESREQLKTMLMDSEDWLYDQSDDSEDPFVEKLNELRDISDPIFLRAHEFDLRPKALSEAERIINYTRNMLDQFKTERSWIPEDETTTLKDKVDKLDAWIMNKTAEQEKLELTEKPAFLSQQIIGKLKHIAKLGSFHLRVWQ